MPSDCLTFKIASEPNELDQIHRLNYRTFVEEIPQHQPNADKLLVDRFHDENTYCICLDGTNLVGMLAMRARRPFSLDYKVPGLDHYLPSGASLCEMRLLAVEPEYRRPGLFARLIRFAAEEGIRQGYTVAVASGTLRQTRLYRRMGFVPFAQPVGSGAARFQPMYLTLRAAKKLFDLLGLPFPSSPTPVSFMPGPVEIAAEVQQFFAVPPISHRSQTLLNMVEEIKQRLCDLTCARGVELLLGSGTLGNDAIAAQIKLLEGRGLVLTNGEFGERLADHAERMGLAFTSMDSGWGTPYDLDALADLLARDNDIAWVWTVHSETSTGMLNDLTDLKAVCQRHGLRLCLDCTSSLGTVPVNLQGVYLASSVSGKGLASLPGIALVFYNHEIVPDRRLPRYLDLGYYRQQQGVPFTHSSNLLTLLCQSLRSMQAEERFAAILRYYTWLRRELEKAGLHLVVPEQFAAPAVLSVALPPGLSSITLGEELERHGYLLSFRSKYLMTRNIIQICLMGNVTPEQCEKMLQMFLTLAKPALPFAVAEPTACYT